MSERYGASPGALCLYDDAIARTFEPFALTRPLAEMRVGAPTLRERWGTVFVRPAAGFLAADHLKEFDEGSVAHADPTIVAGSIVANSRFAPALVSAPGAAANDPAVDVWTNNGRVVAARTARELATSDFADGTLDIATVTPSGGRTAELHGWWLENVWDIVRHLPNCLTDDLGRMASSIDPPHAGSGPPEHATVIGDGSVTVMPGARIEPLVVFDTTAGPIFVDRGAVIQAFTRLVGPCYIGRSTTVLADRINCCSIGEWCRVRGEMSNVVFVGHANKAHDGFLGHSCVGRWVNIGASTVTSNLKNTYGSVALWTPSGLRDTGMQFLGTMFGDHAKTGIGTILTTGSVLGAGANVFGSDMPEKVVPPFAWGAGEPGSTYELDKFLVVAERMMARRDVALTDGMRKTLERAYARRWEVG